MKSLEGWGDGAWPKKQFCFRFWCQSRYVDADHESRSGSRNVYRILLVFVICGVAILYYYSLDVSTIMLTVHCGSMPLLLQGILKRILLMGQIRLGYGWLG